MHIPVLRCESLSLCLLTPEVIASPAKGISVRVYVRVYMRVCVCLCTCVHVRVYMRVYVHTGMNKRYVAPLMLQPPG